MTGVWNLKIAQGKTLNQQFIYKASGSPVDLTGYTARLQVRAGFDSPSAIINLTTENGGIALGGALGTITLNLSASSTAALSPLVGVYDLELISGSGVVKVLLEGSAIITQEATK